MKESYTKTKERINWRRNKVQELVIKGFGQVEISKMLQISEPTISRDVSYLKEESEETIKNHIQKTLPFEFQNCIKGLQEIIKESWIIAGNAEKSGDNKEKLQSLALIRDSYVNKMELLTNASLLQDSIKFVEERKDKLSNNNNNNKGNNNGLERSPKTDRTESTNTIF